MRKRQATLIVIAASALCAALLSSADDNRSNDQPGSRNLQSPENGHRVLRANPPWPDGTAPRNAESVTAAPAARGVSVVARQSALSWYPCAQCHANMPVNPEPRELMAPHDKVLNHGAGQYWCLDCHSAEDRNRLVTLSGKTVGFDESYQVCAQCHYQPRKDWLHGAHGKRVADWDGAREIYSCTHCHNPHDPALRPRAPMPPPPVRAGLGPAPQAHHGSGFLSDLLEQEKEQSRD